MGNGLPFQEETQVVLRQTERERTHCDSLDELRRGGSGGGKAGGGFDQGFNQSRIIGMQRTHDIYSIPLYAAWSVATKRQQKAKRNTIVAGRQLRWFRADRGSGEGAAGRRKSRQLARSVSKAERTAWRESDRAAEQGKADCSAEFALLALRFPASAFVLVGVTAATFTTGCALRYDWQVSIRQTRRRSLSNRIRVEAFLMTNMILFLSLLTPRFSNTPIFASVLF